MFGSVIKLIMVLFAQSRLQQKKQDLSQITSLTAYYAENRYMLIRQNLTSDAKRLYTSAIIMVLGMLLLFIAGMVFVMWLGFYVASMPDRSVILLSIMSVLLFIAVCAIVMVKRYWSKKPFMSDARFFIQRDWHNLKTNLIED